jgi:hypothetical protein
MTIAIKTLLDVSTMSIADLTRRLKEAFEEKLTSLQQDGKLYLTEEEWDARRKKREAENHSAAAQEAVAQAKAMGAAGVVVAVALHQAGHRASPPVMSVGAIARWSIGHVSVARSPRRSRRTSCKMKGRHRSCSRRQP